MKLVSGYGSRVKMVRLDASSSQLRFAKTALSKGASAKNIGRIENEEVKPKLTTLGKIAATGGVSLEWLVTGKVALRPNDIVPTAGVGQRIRDARANKGLTRNALSRVSRLGDTTKNVSRLETLEHRPRARTLVKLAKVLKVSPTYLAYGN